MTERAPLARVDNFYDCFTTSCKIDINLDRVVNPRARSYGRNEEDFDSSRVSSSRNHAYRQYDENLAPSAGGKGSVYSKNNFQRPPYKQENVECKNTKKTPRVLYYVPSYTKYSVERKKVRFEQDYQDGVENPRFSTQHPSGGRVRFEDSKAMFEAESSLRVQTRRGHSEVQEDFEGDSHSGSYGNTWSNSYQQLANVSNNYNSYGTFVNYRC
jgi:hypothetical protein